MRPVFRSSVCRVGVAIAAVLAVVAAASPAAAQCGGTQLCAPGLGDCTVSAACTITLPPAGLFIDLGSRRLVVTKALTVNGPGNVMLTVKAGDVLIDAGTITAPGTNGQAGGITLLSATNITVRNGGILDVSAASDAGIVDLEALGGDMNFSGRIRANGDLTRNGFGGDVTLLATGNVTLGGNNVNVAGGDMGGAGSISIEGTTGAVNVNLPMVLNGGDGGDIDIAAGTTLQTTSLGTITMNANGDGGSAGSLSLSSGGNIQLSGAIAGTGSLPFLQGDGKSGGDGADIDAFSANGSLTIGATVLVSAAAGGSGGTVDLESWSGMTLARAVTSESGGLDGLGGDVFLSVDGGPLAISDRLSVAGNTGSGGSVEAYATGNVTVSAVVTADADFMGGTLLFDGCVVNVTSTGVLSARGPGTVPLSTIDVGASSSMTIAGIVRSTNGNTFEYRQAPVPSVTGSVTPTAVKLLNPALPCCVNCPVTTTTTSTSSTSTSSTAITLVTTTSTTTTKASTTSSPSTTSTTTTTVASVCGDGIKSGAEQCDDHNTVAGDCCSPTCTFEAANSACADDGNPCTRDVCNGAGACTHPAGNAGTTCRAAAGPCDLAETCNGTATTCPADVKRTDVCRAAAGVCDVAESCDGTSNTCPPDGYASASTPCRAAAGACDKAETCTGTGPSCPADQLQPAGTTCRAAAGVCDVAETCTGSSAACPTDLFKPNGTSCAGGDACAASGTCQGGVCSGAVAVSCGPCQTCDPVQGCVDAPMPVCRRPMVAGKARLKLKNSLDGPGRDIVQWKWVNGAATTLQDFGDPVTTDGMTLCIFDGSQATSRLLFRASVPPGGTCATHPCWIGNGKTFKYANSAATPEGIAKMLLIPGASGQSRVLIKARGTALSQRPYEIPTPPMPLPFTVQLQSNDGQCWGASYSRPETKQNNGETFLGLGE